MLRYIVNLKLSSGIVNPKLSSGIVNPKVCSGIVNHNGSSGIVNPKVSLGIVNPNLPSGIVNPNVPSGIIYLNVPSLTCCVLIILKLWEATLFDCLLVQACLLSLLLHEDLKYMYSQSNLVCLFIVELCDCLCFYIYEVHVVSIDM